MVRRRPADVGRIAFTVATINAPKTNSQYHAGFDKIVRVDTPNETTAILHLTEPYGLALDTFFSSRSASLLPRHLLRGLDVNTAPNNALPVGAGPFRFTKWERGDRVELERNPYYALGTPKLERIIFKMIPTDSGTATAVRTGEIDSALGLTYSDVKPVEADPAIHVITLHGVRPSRLTLNVTHPLLTDPDVRHALRLALNRGSILQRSYLGSGVLAESPVTTADPDVARIPLVPYDPAAAARLLDRAGWKVGTDGIRVKNGQRLELEVAAGAGSGFVDQILELMRADWNAVGVAVTTKRYQLSMMFAQAEDGGIVFGGKFDVALFSIGEQSAAEAAVAPLCSRIPPKGTNFSRLCVPAYDALVAKAGATYDPAVAGPLYREAQVRVADLTPAIVLALRNELYLVRDNVAGATIYPFAFFYDPLTLDVVK